MQTKQIVRTLAERLEVPEERADTILKATLTALGRAIPEGEAAKAASQLPADVADPLRTSALQPVETDVDVLLADVAERLDTDGDGARRTVGDVLGTVRQALDDGEWAQLIDVLPAEITTLART